MRFDDFCDSVSRRAAELSGRSNGFFSSSVYGPAMRTIYNSLINTPGIGNLSGYVDESARTLVVLEGLRERRSQGVI